MVGVGWVVLISHVEFLRPVPQPTIPTLNIQPPSLHIIATTTHSPSPNPHPSPHIPSHQKKIYPENKTMPPKRARSTQQTLAFGPRSKITKPTPSIPTSRASKKSKKPSSLLSQQPPRAKVSSSTPSPTFPSEEDDDNTDTTETQHSRKESPGEEGETLLAIRQPPTPARRSEIETRAAKLGSVDLNRYWRGKEEERKARRGLPPVPPSLYIKHICVYIH